MAFSCLSFVAPSGTGKTTLLADVIERLVAQGRRLAVLKASHHDHRLDVPGKDSHRFSEAGAGLVALVGPSLTTLFLGTGHGRWPGARAVVDWVAACPWLEVDLVLCEGFSFDPGLPKLRVVRGEWPAELNGAPQDDLVAVAWDGGARPAGLPPTVPILPLDGTEVSRWVAAWADRDR